MAIRLRKIGDLWIALCAAETDKQDGDVYLDDGQHEALALKFCTDWKQGPYYGESNIVDQRRLLLMESQKVRDAEATLSEWLDQQKEAVND